MSAFRVICNQNLLFDVQQTHLIKKHDLNDDDKPGVACNKDSRYLRARDHEINSEVRIKFKSW